MTKQQMNQAILKVAEATSQTKEEIATKMFKKDYWTWYLIEEAAK